MATERGSGDAVKIEWLDGDMKSARLTRGFWRWRRVATVTRMTLEDWKFAHSGDDVEVRIKDKIEGAFWDVKRKRAQAEKERRNWAPVEPPPTARLVERNQ
jgi:hypothetical protein